MSGLSKFRSSDSRLFLRRVKPDPRMRLGTLVGLLSGALVMAMVMKVIKLMVKIMAGLEGEGARGDD